MTAALRCISSMATRQVLAELATQWQGLGGAPLQIESVGGVDAAKRVRAGEAFDIVFLARDALDTLAADAHLRANSVVDLARSGVSVAVPAGAAQPDLRDAERVRQAVLAAPRVGYSTGPSGTALIALFERWGIRAALEGRLVQARAGVPVAALLAKGEVDLGFQQLSELINVPGIEIAGPLPAEIDITTVFSGAIGARSDQPAQAQRALAFMASAAADEAKLGQGMRPA